MTVRDRLKALAAQRDQLRATPCAHCQHAYHAHAPWPHGSPCQHPRIGPGLRCRCPRFIDPDEVLPT